MDKHTEEMMKRAQESFDKMMEKSTPAQRQDAAFKAMYGAAMLHEPTMVKADRKQLDQLSGPVFIDLQPMRVAEHEDEIASLRAELEAAKGEAEALRKGIVAASYLMDNSDGVYGMHLNGDQSPWAELRTGGRFEAWLVEFDDAIAAVDAARGKDNG